MNKDTIAKSGLLADLAGQIDEAISHHDATGRRAAVTCKISVKKVKDSGKTEIAYRIVSTLPVREEDQVTTKQPAVVLAKIGGDHPGQTKIDGVGDE